MHKISIVVVTGLIVASQSACSSKSLDIGDPGTREMVSLLMPAQIIVDPITHLKAFDEAEQPNGLFVVLRAEDSFGDRIKIAGVLLIELYEFRPAAGDAKGRKIEQWDLALSSTGDQQDYWNRFAQMYDIPLLLSPEALADATGDKYVVQVTYNTPLGEHMMAERIFTPPIRSRSTLAEQ